MAEGSLCAMGGMTPIPVRSVLAHFPGTLDGPAALSRGLDQQGGVDQAEEARQ